MNGNEVFDKIEEIAACASKNGKEDLVREAIKDDLFRKVMLYAYNPYWTYGVKPDKPKIEDPGLEEFGEHCFMLLDQLKTRNLTGNAARDAIEAVNARLTLTGRQLLWRILSKDMRCGMTANTLNRVEKGVIPVFTCMLAKKYEEDKHIQPDARYLVEPKLDGVRALCIYKDQEAKFYTRTGKELPAVERLCRSVEKMIADLDLDEVGLPPERVYVVLDGELIAGEFNKTVGDVRRKSEQAEDAVFWIFDYIGGVEFERGVSHYCTETRSFHLEAHFQPDHYDGLKLVPAVYVESDEHVDAKERIRNIYASYREQGYEGAIVKPASGLYERKRSAAWLKIKPEETEDLIIVGAFEGEGKYEGQLGGVIVDRNGVEVRIGGGFSDAERVDLWAKWLEDANWIDSLMGQPNVDQVKEYIDDMDAGQIVGRMIEVEYHEVTPDGSLRHPRYKRFRDDKHDPAVAA